MSIIFEKNLDPTVPRKMLLLPRETKFGELPGCDPIRDHIDIIPRDQWDEIVRAREEQKVGSIKDAVWYGLDQNGRGSCAHEQVGSALMLCRELSGDEDQIVPNPWPNYWVATGGRDNGSSIDGAYRIGMERGSIPQSVCSRGGSYKRQPQEYWDIAQKYRLRETFDVDGLDEFVSALLQGFTVGYGRRGHALCGVQYCGKFKFKAQGSWGSWTDCNDPGFHWEDARRDLGGYGIIATRTTFDSGDNNLSA